MNSTVNQNGVSSNTNVSSDNIIRCEKCTQPRFFKGERGLNIHISRIHKNNNPSIDSSSHSLPSSSREPFWKTLSKLKHTTPIIKRIPRGARPTVAQTLSSVINNVLKDNSISSWEHLFTFAYRTLHISRDVNSTHRHISLTTRIKDNCSNNHVSINNCTSRTTSKSLFQYVESKINDGDIKGASRILFSDDSVAPNTSDTLSALRQKHPPPATDIQLPDPPDPFEQSIHACPAEVLRAINSFRSGTAGGMDGLTAQHLKDLANGGSTEAVNLLNSLTALINLMLSALNFGAEALKSPILMLACVERYLEPNEAVLLARLEEEYQLARWGRVPWAHELNQAELTARVSASLLVIQCAGESHTAQAKASPGEQNNQ